MPDLSSVSASAGSCTVYTPWTPSNPLQHPGQEGTQNLLSPRLSMTTGNPRLGRQRPGQFVFALSQSVQLSFLPAGVFFLCQLQTTERPGHGPGLWSCAQCLAFCPGVVKCLHRESVPSAACPPIFSLEQWDEKHPSLSFFQAYPKASPCPCEGNGPCVVANTG